MARKKQQQQQATFDVLEQKKRVLQGNWYPFLLINNRKNRCATIATHSYRIGRLEDTKKNDGHSQQSPLLLPFPLPTLPRFRVCPLSLGDSRASRAGSSTIVLSRLRCVISPTWEPKLPPQNTCRSSSSDRTSWSMVFFWRAQSFRRSAIRAKKTSERGEDAGKTPTQYFFHMQEVNGHKRCLPFNGRGVSGCITRVSMTYPRRAERPRLRTHQPPWSRSLGSVAGKGHFKNIITCVEAWFVRQV